MVVEKIKKRTNCGLNRQRDQDTNVSNEIFKEFNAECVISFFKLIFDKESIFYLDRAKL